MTILSNLESTKEVRKIELLEEGYPAYTTSAGWLGYSDEKLRFLLREGISEGWNYFNSSPYQGQIICAVIFSCAVVALWIASS